MKKYFNLLVAVMIAAFSLTLTACGDDDDDDNSALIGTWENYQEDLDYGWAYYESVTFNKDNTFTQTDIETENGHTYTNNAFGTYAVSGKLKDGAQLAMNFIDEDGDTWSETVLCRIDGKKAYITTDEGDIVVMTKK